MLLPRERSVAAPRKYSVAVHQRATRKAFERVSHEWAIERVTDNW
jgi:hypothetical protein